MRRNLKRKLERLSDSSPLLLWQIQGIRPADLEFPGGPLESHSSTQLVLRCCSRLDDFYKTLVYKQHFDVPVHSVSWDGSHVDSYTSSGQNHCSHGKLRQKSILKPAGAWIKKPPALLTISSYRILYYAVLPFQQHNYF